MYITECTTTDTVRSSYSSSTGTGRNPTCTYHTLLYVIVLVGIFLQTTEYYVVGEVTARDAAISVDTTRNSAPKESTVVRIYPSRQPVRFCTCKLQLCIHLSLSLVARF